MSHLI